MKKISCICGWLLCWETGTPYRHVRTISREMGSRSSAVWKFCIYLFLNALFYTFLIDTFIWSKLDSPITVSVTRLRDYCMLRLFMRFLFLHPKNLLLSYLSEGCLIFQHILHYNSQLLNTGHFEMIIYSYCATRMCLFCAFHKLGSGDICHSRECA